MSKKSSTLRIISLFCALLIGATAIGCGSDGTSEVTTAETTSASTTVVDDSRVQDNLPELDLEGRTVNILIREDMAYEFDTEQSGDIMDDVVYERNQDIMDRFNLNLEYIVEPGNWAYKDTYQSLITTAVLANDSTYDIVTGQSNIIIPLAVQGMFYDAANAKYIDYSQPYWKEGFFDNININGKIYVLGGDFAISMLSASNVIFFNKDLMDEYQIEYPYDLVRNGTWTVDKFFEMATTVTADLNGDGFIGGEDLHGFCGYNNSIQPFFYGSELSYMSMGEDGKRYIDFPNDKAIDIFDRFSAFCQSDSWLDASKAYTYESSASGAVEQVMASTFINGNHLMIGMKLEFINMLRNMESDFGVVPYPKYDEAQEDYHVSILRTFTVSAIPLSATDYDTAGLVLEALACEGYNDIIPAYYEVALKDKYSRDDGTVEMLDIISNSAYLDFADAFYTELGISDYFAGYVMAGQSNLVSSFESQRKSLQTKLDKLYESFEE